MRRRSAVPTSGSMQTVSAGGRDLVAFDPTQTYEDGTPQVGLDVSAGEFSSLDYQKLQEKVRVQGVQIQLLETRVAELEKNPATLSYFGR